MLSETRGHLVFFGWLVEFKVNSIATESNSASVTLGCPLRRQDGYLVLWRTEVPAVTLLPH